MLFGKAAGAAVLMVLAGWFDAALAAPRNWQLGMPAPATPVMAEIADFHRLLLIFGAAIFLFVLALLAWIAIRYNRRANPVPGRTQRNPLLEATLIVIPIIVLVLIAIESIHLLYFEATVPAADLTLKAVGRQFYWTYEYPKEGIRFDSRMLSDAAASKAGEPRLLGVNNPLVVPVDKIVEVDITAADVIHSWSVPAFGVKMDAVPGRLNRTWFKATRTGKYYGQCSELCGSGHAYMPIEVKVVSATDYAAWLAEAKKRFAVASAAAR